MYIVVILSLLFGLILFPILFYFQHLFQLSIPNIEKEKVHIHHSFYGLLLVIIGIAVFFIKAQLGLSLTMIGIGFIIHHEITEPNLKGLDKLIYINPKFKKRSDE